MQLLIIYYDYVHLQKIRNIKKLSLSEFGPDLLKKFNKLLLVQSLILVINDRMY